MINTTSRNPSILWIGEHSAETREAVHRARGQRPVVLYGKGLEILARLGIDNAEAVKTEPIEKIRGPWDKRGFQSYQHHPIFNGLHGGFYSVLLDVLDPPYGEVSLYCGKNAKVIAVEKRFIDYVRSRALIWEYPSEKILCVGGFLYPETRRHYPYETLVERFRANIEDYMLRASSEEYPCWPEITHGFFEKTASHKELVIEKAHRFPDATPLRISVPKLRTGHYTNTSGARILVNAVDDGNIREVWAHPYRILKKLEIAVDGRPLSSLLINTVIEPAYLLFETEEASVLVFASIDKPLLGIQFEARDSGVHRISLRFETDLRISWPMDDDYSGDRRYTKDAQTGTLSFWTGDHRCACRMTVNRPAEIEATSDENLLTGALAVSMQHSLCLTLCAAIEGEELIEGVSFQEELDRSVHYYADYLDRCVRIRADHSEWDRRIERAMIATLKFRVSTPLLGTGLVAGYANSRSGWNRARPGYAWYFGRDSEWVSLAMLDWGDAETVRENLELLIRYQELTGKIYHELSTSGLVHYDAADATPLFLLTAIRYLKHTGNIEWFKRYKRNLLMALDYCASTDTDGDGCIENTIAGHGWIEGGKLYLSHASLYLNVIWHIVLKELVDLLPFIEEDSVTFDKVSSLHLKVAHALPRFLNPERQRYGLGIDVNGERIDHFTVLPAVGIYLGSLTGAAAQAHARDFSRYDYSTDWGVRIIGKSSGVYNPGGYHEGSVWPLFTGWASLSEFAAGAALSGFTHVCASLKDSDYYAKGYIREVLHGELYQSSGVCLHQAWSESMAVQPWIEGVVGFSPDALKKAVTLSPQIPPNLSRLTVSQLKCGDAEISLDYERSQEIGDAVTVHQRYRVRSNRDLEIDFAPYIPKQAENIRVVVGQKRPKPEGVRVSSEKRFSYPSGYSVPDSPPGIHYVKIPLPKILCSDEVTIEIDYQTPFEWMAIVPEFSEHGPSRFPRIIGWEKTNCSWLLETEVPANVPTVIYGYLGKKYECKGSVYHEGALRCEIKGSTGEYYAHFIEIEG